MARGKKAAQAARRQGAQALATTEDMYQRRVAKLTAEVKELNQKLIDKQSAHSREVRSLKAAMREGMSPELVMTRQELQRARDQAQTERQRRAEMGTALRAMWADVCRHIVEEHHLKGSECISYIAGHFPRVYSIAPEGLHGYLKTEENTHPRRAPVGGLSVVPKAKSTVRKP